jgi:hypothetical protein
MKTIAKNTNLMFAVILGIVFSFSVSGQITNKFSLCDKMNPESHFLSNKPGHLSINVGQDAWQPVYKSTQGSFPQEIHHFYWDVTTIWMADYDKMVSYDNFGNMLNEIMVDANTGDTSTQIVNTYDIEGRMTTSLSQLWVNGNWENNQKLYYEFDEHGNQTIFLQQNWQGNSWVANSGTKYTYTYDINDHITEKVEQWWDNNIISWINYYKSIYNYDLNGYLIERIFQQWDSNTSSWNSSSKQTYTNNSSGVTIEMLAQTWDNVNSIWVNDSRYINLIWHNWTGDFNASEFESYTVLYWTNGIWENYYRINITYDAYGGSIKIMETYFNGNWANSTRETNSFDEHGNSTCYTFEFWINNVWVIDMGTNFLLTYSGNDIIQRIVQNYDHINMLWVNMFKEEYSDFIYTQGIASGSSLPADLSVYPNPTSGILYISMDGNGQEVHSLEIVNLNGQVVYQSQLNVTDLPIHEIDLSNCSKGVYFVKLRNANDVKVGKVILQ